MAELKKCNADEIEALISATPDSGVCKLSKKEYYITRRIEIRARHGLTLDGNGAKIITRYKNNAHPTESSELFLIEGCEDVMLCNIVADTDVPVNVSATVESVDKERGSAIFKIDDNFQINGDEQLTFFDSIDGDGSPDWLLHHYFLHPDRSVETVMQREILLANTYWSAKYDYLGERRFRVYFPLEERKLEKTFAGQRVSIRHTDKGPGAIVLKNSDRTVLRDITLHSVPGMAVIVLPRCTDLSIERMHVIPAKESGCYFACNFDGIHVAGLGGKLILKDCNFFGMGDDSLNVHSTMGTLTAILGEKSFKCNYCKKSRNGELGDSWCREGDIIRAYDPISMELRGRCTVESFKDGVLNASYIEGELLEGYVLQNAAFAPVTEVSGCEVRNSVARGFIIQTDAAKITDCRFFGIAGSALKASPDFEYWYEAGPTADFIMRDNDIQKCAFYLRSSVIEAQTNHFGKVKEVRGVHKKIVIENNRISDTDAVCIDIYSAEQVTVRGNSFPESVPEPVRIRFCDNVKIV